MRATTAYRRGREGNKTLLFEYIHIVDLLGTGMLKHGRISHNEMLVKVPQLLTYKFSLWSSSMAKKVVQIWDHHLWQFLNI